MFKNKREEIVKDELLKTIKVILDDPIIRSFSYLHQLCKDAPNLLEEKEELETLLTDSRFQIFSHVGKVYKKRIKKIDQSLIHLKRICRLVGLGYSLSTDYPEGYAGFIEDPGRIMESPEDSVNQLPKGAQRIHHHGLFFGPIPSWVLKKYLAAKPLFDICFIFSKQSKDFLALSDQRMHHGLWLNVKELGWFQKEMQEKIQKTRYGNEQVSIVGFLPLEPEEDLEYCFRFLTDGLPKARIHNGIGFHIASWNPKKEMEKNSNKILVAQPTAS